MSWTHMMHPRHFSLIFQAQEVAPTLTLSFRAYSPKRDSR